jgi:hypothetical protein
MLVAVVVVIVLLLPECDDQFLNVQPEGAVALVGAVNLTKVLVFNTPDPPVWMFSPPVSFEIDIVAVVPAPALQAAFVKPW